MSAVLEAAPAGELVTQSAASDATFGAAQTQFEHFELDHDFSQDDFDRFLNWAVDRRASDLTIQSGDYITAQIQGIWQTVTSRRLEHNEVERIVMWKYGDSGPAVLNSAEPLDFRLQAVMTRDHVLGFRANVTRCRIGPMQEGFSITARAIPGLPPRLAELHLEHELLDNLFPRYGLILVVGTTGSGKSTLMAATLRERLENDKALPAKIITYEDPVEFTFGELGLGRMPLVSQAEIGQGGDLLKFGYAGPNAMRRKADVIVMGEMRDLDSVSEGLKMAESGHCVMATLHVDTPAEAIDRIISFYPASQQLAVASKLRAVLRVIVAQKLAVNQRGTRTAFRSWLVCDRGVKDQLGTLSPDKWQPLVARITAERGSDFEARAFPALQQGLIGWTAFKEVCGMTNAEALKFCAQRGFDASHLD